MFYGVIRESYEIITTKDMNFDGVKIKINIKDSYNSKDSKLVQKVDSVLKTICSPSLYGYLYNLDKDFYETEINTDPYYDGKTIKSGKDLMNAIKEEITNKNTCLYIDGQRNCIYFCGEYWIDPEHGFSIVFPGGNFVKAKSNKDKKYDSHYNPLITYIGQYSDAL
jgi:hypothetical protein